MGGRGERQEDGGTEITLRKGRKKTGMITKRHSEERRRKRGWEGEDRRDKESRGVDNGEVRCKYIEGKEMRNERTRRVKRLMWEEKNDDGNPYLTYPLLASFLTHDLHSTSHTNTPFFIRLNSSSPLFLNHAFLSYYLSHL